MKKKLVMLLTLIFMIGICAGAVFSANAAVAVTGTAADFTISYANAKAGTNFSGGGTFDDTGEVYKSVGGAGAGESVILGGATQDFSDFILETEFTPKVINEWSNLKIWFKVWDNKSWAGAFFEFSLGESMDDQSVRFGESAKTGSTTGDGVTTIGDPVDYDYLEIDKSGPWEFIYEPVALKIVVLGGKAAAFIDGERILYTESMISDVGHFEIECWDASFELGFPITCSTTVTNDDLLPATDPGGETGETDFAYEEGSFHADFTTFELNALDGTAQTEGTMVDFGGNSAIITDAGSGDKLFAQGSNGGETNIYFGSDFSGLDADKWSDFTLSARLKAEYAHNDWAWAKILFRGEDNRTAVDAISASGSQKNCYKLNFKNNMIWLTTDVDSAEKTIDAANFPFKKNVFYDIKLIAKGSYIACFINGEKLLEVEDVLYNEGIFSFCSWQTKYYIETLDITDSVLDDDISAARVVKCGNDIDFNKSGYNLNEWYLSSSDDIRIANDGDKKILQNFVTTNESTALFGEGNMKDVLFRFNISITDADNDGWLLKALFRSNGWSANSYYVQMSASSLTLFREDLQVPAQLGSTYNYNFAGNKYYDIAITAKGGAINVYLNGNKVINAVDNNYGVHANGMNMMGPCGFVSWNTGYKCDSIEIETFTNQVIEPKTPGGGDDDGGNGGCGGCGTVNFFSSGTGITFMIILAAAVLLLVFLLKKKTVAPERRKK